MELGLNRNILSHPYKKFRHLVTHSWYKLLWEYASKYKISIHFDTRFHIRSTGVGDLSLTDLFSEQDYGNAREVQLQCVRKFLNVHSLLLTSSFKMVKL